MHYEELIVLHSRDDHATESDFWVEFNRLDNLLRGLAVVSFTTAIENTAGCFADLKESEAFDFWRAAIYCLKTETAERLAEIGIDPAQYGLNY